MRFDEILGIKYPIIQGAMANISTGKFAAEVANAGGLGLIAGGALTAEELRKEIRICKEMLTKDCPGKFGVNIMLLNPDADNLAKVVIEEGVKYVTTGAGMPRQYMKAWKEAGIFVMPVVSGVTLAKVMSELGADAIIAEGTESGGHVGEMTTMTLVVQIAEAIDIPVIAAGGIASGRQMAAAYALGACGVQIGTVLLATVECPIHDNYKAAILKAKDNDTIVTGRINGSPVRNIKNNLTREYLKKEKEGANKKELEELTIGSLKRAVRDGDTQNGSLMAGQVCGQIKEIKTVAEVLSDMVNECNEVLANLK